MFNRKNKASSMFTVVSEGTTITGKVESSNNILVFGVVKSAERDAIETSGSVRVAPNSTVEGQITAGDIVIEGVVRGDIKSTGQVKLSKGSVLVGDITAHSLSIEDGVKFTGGVRVELSSDNIDEEV